VLSAAGPVVRRARVRGREERVRLLQGVPDRFAVGYQASGGSGHDHDLLQPLAARALVAHPGPLRLSVRSQSQNDRNDAGRLAQLPYLGETPTVPGPSLAGRTWRALINGRSQVIAQRTRAQNARRPLRRGAGGVPPTSPGLGTQKGRAGLRQLELPPAAPRRRRDLRLQEVEARNGQVRRRQRELNRRAQPPPAVARRRRIPGVGLRTAEAGVAFRDDPQRFRHAQAVGRYFGLVPCPDQSGDQNRLGHIPRGAGGRPPAPRRGHVAGGAARADGPRALGAGPAR